MSIEGRLLIVDLKSGAMDGHYDPRQEQTAREVAALLSVRHAGSCWVVVQVKHVAGRVPATVPTDLLWHQNKLGFGADADDAVKSKTS